MSTQQQKQYEMLQAAQEAVKGRTLLAYLDNAGRVIVPIHPRNMEHGIMIQCSKCYKFMKGNSFTRHKCKGRYKPKPKEAKKKKKLATTAAAAFFKLATTTAAAAAGGGDEHEDEDEGEHEDEHKDEHEVDKELQKQWLEQKRDHRKEHGRTGLPFPKYEDWKNRKEGAV